MGYSSQAGHIIVKTQATPGVYDPATGTSGVAVKLRTGSLGPTRELLIPDPEIGGGRDVADAYLGAGAFSGDYEMYPRMDSLLTFLNAVLGSTSSATASGVNTHTITPSDASQLPFLSIEERIGAGLEVYQYNDAVVNTLHLESDANGYLMGTAGIIAAKQIAGATATDDSTAAWDNGPMSVGTNITVTYNGVSLPAKSFSLDINNNFEDDDFRLGSFYLGDLTPKRREVTLSFSLRHNNSAMWRQAVYGAPAATQMGGVTTKQQLVLTITTYESIPGSSPVTPYSLTLTFPKFILRPFAFSASGDDIIENDVEGQAVRPAVATPLMTAVLKNGKAAVV